MSRFRLFTVLSVLTLCGCSTAYLDPIPVADSEVCYAEITPVTISDNPEGLPEYRTCLTKSNADYAGKLNRKLEILAAKFCAGQAGYYKPLTRRIANRDDNGNARVEIIFCCTSCSTDAKLMTNVKSNRRSVKEQNHPPKGKFDNLAKLHALYQAGALSEAEFLAEKERLLAQ